MKSEDVVAHRIFSCSGKVKLSHEQAKQKAKKYGLYYYHCKHCEQYHLTRQPTYDSILITTFYGFYELPRNILYYLHSIKFYKF